MAEVLGQLSKHSEIFIKEKDEIKTLSKNGNLFPHDFDLLELSPQPGIVLSIKKDLDKHVEAFVNVSMCEKIPKPSISRDKDKGIVWIINYGIAQCHYIALSKNESLISKMGSKKFATVYEFMVHKQCIDQIKWNLNLRKVLTDIIERNLESIYMMSGINIEIFAFGQCIGDLTKLNAKLFTENVVYEQSNCVDIPNKDSKRKAKNHKKSNKFTQNKFDILNDSIIKCVFQNKECLLKNNINGTFNDDNVENNHDVDLNMEGISEQLNVENNFVHPSHFLLSKSVESCAYELSSLEIETPDSPHVINDHCHNNIQPKKYTIKYKNKSSEKSKKKIKKNVPPDLVTVEVPMEGIKSLDDIEINIENEIIHINSNNGQRFSIPVNYPMEQIPKQMEIDAEVFYGEWNLTIESDSNSNLSEEEIIAESDEKFYLPDFHVNQDRNKILTIYVDCCSAEKLDFQLKEDSCFILKFTQKKKHKGRIKYRLIFDVSPNKINSIKHKGGKSRFKIFNLEKDNADIWLQAKIGCIFEQLLETSIKTTKAKKKKGKTRQKCMSESDKDSFKELNEKYFGEPLCPDNEHAADENVFSEPKFEVNTNKCFRANSYPKGILRRTLSESDDAYSLDGFTPQSEKELSFDSLMEIPSSSPRKKVLFSGIVSRQVFSRNLSIIEENIKIAKSELKTLKKNKRFDEDRAKSLEWKITQLQNLSSSKDSSNSDSCEGFVIEEPTFEGYDDIL